MLKLCFGYQKEQEGRDEILKYNSAGNFDELWDNLKPRPTTHDILLYHVDNRTQERLFGKDAQIEQRHASEFIYPTLVSFRYISDETLYRMVNTQDLQYNTIPTTPHSRSPTIATQRNTINAGKGGH